jgi:hypothetical protein
MIFSSAQIVWPFIETRLQFYVGLASNADLSTTIPVARKILKKFRDIFGILSEIFEL